MYYLQSRYYDPEVGRFLNADDTGMLGMTDSVLGNNLFAYCENEPVNDVDPTGYLSIEIGSAVLSVALFFALAITASFIESIMSCYFSSFAFQNALSRDYNKLRSPIITNNGKIDILLNLVKTYSKKAVKFVAKSITVSIAVAKVKSTVKKNAKYEYWTATIKPYYVDVGRGISYNDAVAKVKSGQNVFTTTKSNAKKVAKAAGNNKKPVGPEIDKGKENTPGFYNHFHIYKRKNKGHVFYLFNS